MDALDILEINDVMGSRGHAKLIGENFNKTFDNWDSARRHHVQSMNDKVRPGGCGQAHSDVGSGWHLNRFDLHLFLQRNALNCCSIVVVF